MLFKSIKKCVRVSIVWRCFAKFDVVAVGILDEALPCAIRTALDFAGQGNPVGLSVCGGLSNRRHSQRKMSLAMVVVYGLRPTNNEMQLLSQSKSEPRSGKTKVGAGKHRQAEDLAIEMDACF